jgi:tellurite methyltransferase
VGIEQPFSVRYFDAEFQRQIATQDFALNPIEEIALPFVRGEVLDLGCGLGNLTLEAAKRGCLVTAVDGSRTAVRRVRGEAKRLGLRVRVVAADLDRFEIDGQYDSVICLGVLMFLAPSQALGLLREVHDAVKPDGVAAIKVYVEGTTFTGSLDPERHYLFPKGAIERAFAGWETVP